MKFITLSLFIIVVVFTSQQVLAFDDYPRNSMIDAIHYRLHIQLSDTSNEIKGETEILFEFKQNNPKTIRLDLAGMTVSAVLEEGREAKFSHTDNHLDLTLRGNYREGDRCRIAVKYSGKPSDGLIFQKNKFGDSGIFADNWPNRAHFWFPSIDHPYDKATVEYLVTAPTRFEVIANGKLIEKINLQNGQTLFHWHETVPIPVYCMVIGATEFSIVNIGSAENVQLSYYLYPKDREKAIKGWGRALQMISYYTNLIGPFPYEKLSLVQSSTRFGGMENASSIFFHENALNEGVVAHEMAHQWFGDSITESDWHHLWLSEGFASYFGPLFFEHVDGRDKFVKKMLAIKESYLKASAKDNRPIYDPQITDLMKLLNHKNYQKGSWVLHMLRHIMGDDKFFAGIRDYYRTYRDRTALTDDFRKVMEFHYGQSLDWFFKQWIFEHGHPIYDVIWKWNETTKEVTLQVIQKQEKTIFDMPIDVSFTVNKKDKREVIKVSKIDEKFTFKLDSKPETVSIDPDEWVLKVLTIKEEK